MKHNPAWPDLEKVVLFDSKTQTHLRLKDVVRDNGENFRRETLDANGNVTAFMTMMFIEQMRLQNDSIPPFGYYRRTK